ncbi:hypothetical protein GZH49_10910 [Nocardia terpenica]|uniref:hypothetical protein n=1 Tax=Nocardia terpenica TaxID=455432 RepID=UPI002FE13CE3
MDMSLTEASAQQRINTHLLDTLQALPDGAALSLTPDSSDLGRLGEQPAITVPCDDNNDDPRKPFHLQISYWLIGVPPGQNAHYFQLIRDTWTQRGFRLSSDADSIWAPVSTPDGYHLVVQYVRDKDQSVSITAGSPCFPESGKGTTTPQPTELRRPS